MLTFTTLAYRIDNMYSMVNTNVDKTRKQNYYDKFWFYFTYRYSYDVAQNEHKQDLLNEASFTIFMKIKKQLKINSPFIFRTPSSCNFPDPPYIFLLQVYFSPYLFESVINTQFWESSSISQGWVRFFWQLGRLGSNIHGLTIYMVCDIQNDYLYIF